MRFPYSNYAKAVLPLLIGGAALWGAACTTPKQQEPTNEIVIDSSAVHLRINQVGYLPDDAKVAIAFSHYGWGANSYRAAYFATGEPQGLNEYQSKATGVANLAGRVTAAMAGAYRVWRQEDAPFALASLEKARSAYALGKANKGYQQGNSYGAPYRYTENTWADDMEWGAAELYRVTGEENYLEDAKRYARLAATTSWMPRYTTEHYESPLHSKL